MFTIDEILHERMRSYGEESYEKFLSFEIRNDWKKIVDEKIFRNVKPVELRREILFVNIISSSFRDQIKYFYEELIEAINRAYKRHIINEIKITAVLPPSNNSQKNFNTTTDETIPCNIELTEAEITECKKKLEVEEFECTERNMDFFSGLMQYQKNRKANGDHECENCGRLCKKYERFCEVCTIKEKEIQRKFIQRVLYDEPWLKSYEVKKKLLEKFPKNKDDCFIEIIDSARSSLIQQLVGGINLDNEKSEEVMRVVMLEKQTKLEKITLATIQRTLNELRIPMQINYLRSILQNFKTLEKK